PSKPSSLRTARGFGSPWCLIPPRPRSPWASSHPRDRVLGAHRRVEVVLQLVEERVGAEGARALDPPAGERGRGLLEPSGDAGEPLARALGLLVQASALLRRARGPAGA